MSSESSTTRTSWRRRFFLDVKIFLAGECAHEPATIVPGGATTPHRRWTGARSASRAHVNRPCGRETSKDSSATSCVRQLCESRLRIDCRDGLGIFALHCRFSSPQLNRKRECFVTFTARTNEGRYDRWPNFRQVVLL